MSAAPEPLLRIRELGVRYTSGRETVDAVRELAIAEPAILVLRHAHP